MGRLAPFFVVSGRACLLLLIILMDASRYRGSHLLKEQLVETCIGSLLFGREGEKVSSVTFCMVTLGVRG